MRFTPTECETIQIALLCYANRKFGWFSRMLLPGKARAEVLRLVDKADRGKWGEE